MLAHAPISALSPAFRCIFCYGTLLHHDDFFWCISLSLWDVAPPRRPFFWHFGWDVAPHTTTPLRWLVHFLGCLLDVAPHHHSSNTTLTGSFSTRIWPDWSSVLSIPHDCTYRRSLFPATVRLVVSSVGRSSPFVFGGSVLSLVFSRLRLAFGPSLAPHSASRIFPVWLACAGRPLAAWCFLCVAPLVPPTQVPRFGAPHAVAVSVVFGDKNAGAPLAPRAAPIRLPTQRPATTANNDYAPPPALSSAALSREWLPRLPPRFRLAACAWRCGLACAATRLISRPVLRFSAPAHRCASTCSA